MKLAEALIERAELQKKNAQLINRINDAEVHNGPVREAREVQHEAERAVGQAQGGSRGALPLLMHKYLNASPEHYCVQLDITEQKPLHPLIEATPFRAKRQIVQHQSKVCALRQQDVCRKIGGLRFTNRRRTTRRESSISRS